MTDFDDKNTPDRCSDQGQGTVNEVNGVPPHSTIKPENGAANRPVFSPSIETLREWIAKAKADPNFAGRGQCERWEARLRELEAASAEARPASVEARPASVEAKPASVESPSLYLLELAEHHREMLHASRISDEVIRARGYRTVINPIELVTLGFNEAQARTPGLLLPGHTPDGQLFFVYRPDNPRCSDNKHKPKNPDGTYPQTIKKYEFPKEHSMRLDCPPTCRPELADPSVPLWITEGQKKGDALASAGKCVIALLGVWAWRGSNERAARPPWRTGTSSR